MKIFRINVDMLGIGVSLICAIHCAVLPLLLNSLPLFGLNILHNEAFELGMILLAAAIGIYALWHGYYKHHRNFLPYGIFLAGIILLLLKQAFHAEYELVLLIPSVIMIISSHMLNFYLSRRLSKDCTLPQCS